ncbi:MAG: class I SAM-dependent methyltransferase [Acidobacteriota bacterium]
MILPLELPVPPGYFARPVWTGNGFRIGDAILRVLSYGGEPAGWTDELTQVHEDVAGEDHYIDRASREHAGDELERWMSTARPVVIDIGCSSGFLLKSLRKRFPGHCLLGADCVPGPLERLAAAMPDLPLMQFDLPSCPLPDGCFDAVVLLNVLEHVEDDLAAVRQVYRILKPGGVAVVEVPAGPHLYDVYDRQLLHYRRYRMGDLTALFQRAGFRVLARSHLGFFLYPAFRTVKKRNQKYLREAPEIQREIVRRSIRRSSNSPLMYGIMKLEAALRRWVRYPAGIRCLVTCRRPAE